MKFVEFFRQATRSDKEPNGRDPYPFQERFAEADPLPHLVRAPTGAGKTATAVLGWLWRYFHGKKPTPRRLVYCLPMRVLVEQSYSETTKWIAALTEAKFITENVAVHRLMGGVDIEQWHLHPERPAVLIGTQDMLLSRALNRGYAASRFHWPIDFGLLNNDCLWVFDEPQLMASGVSTSAQLAGLRQKLNTFGGCPSVWMSATLERGWLRTVDMREYESGLLELRPTSAELSSGELGRRMKAKKIVRRASPTTADKNYVKATADAIAEAHKPGTLTLAVLNIVDRAKALYQELPAAFKREKKPFPAPLLIHSRFRPVEREERNSDLKKLPGDLGRVVVATQVVEAGVDISARVLFTELAPWASIVQRLGRCHRYGEFADADGYGEVYWIDVPGDDKATRPYAATDLAEAKRYLTDLEGQNVSPQALVDYRWEGEPVELKFEHKHVVRRRDVLDLFDTSPDLSGNDIDVARFVRGDDSDTDMQVFWRDGKPDNEWDARERRRQAARREELCNVPIGDFKKFLDADKTVYRWDFLDEKWRTVGKRDASSVVPGHVFWVPADQGGYDEKLGWDLAAKALPPELILPLPTEAKSRKKKQRDDTAYDTNDWSHFDWKTIAEHTGDVVAELNRILASGLSLTPAESAVLEAAVRWHDWGKAHAVFQTYIKAVAVVPDPKGPKGATKQEPRPDKWVGHTFVAKAPDEFWNRRCSRNTGGEKPAPVSRFRHELASALGILALDRDNKLPADWQTLSPEQRDLALYLIAAHHGKVRLSIRVMPEENPVPPDPSKTKFAAGVWDGDELPVTELGNSTTTEAVKLDLSPMLLGNGSWTARALAVRDRLGPFRLAYLEALVRAADCRASAAADGTKEDGDA